jgi:hypothetical protein
MVTLLDKTTRLNVLHASSSTDRLLRSNPAGQWMEEIRAALGPNTLADVPGLFAENPADRCRTWICDFTRAVPHGSFL